MLCTVYMMPSFTHAPPKGDSEHSLCCAVNGSKAYTHTSGVVSGHQANSLFAVGPSGTFVKPHMALDRVCSAFDLGGSNDSGAQQHPAWVAVEMCGDTPATANTCGASLITPF